MALKIGKVGNNLKNLKSLSTSVICLFSITTPVYLYATCWILVWFVDLSDILFSWHTFIGQKYLNRGGLTIPNQVSSKWQRVFLAFCFEKTHYLLLPFELFCIQSSSCYFVYLLFRFLVSLVLYGSFWWGIQFYMAPCSGIEFFVLTCV